MNGFCCPVCKSAFNDNGSSFVCQKGHCFDKAKSGYVNLLIAQGKKGHGDDKLMVNARKCFLSKGYYLPLLEKIRLTVEKYAFNGCTMLDSGCGEGWYTCGIQEYLEAKGVFANILAVDISKEALNAAAKRSKSISWAVGSAYKLPVFDGSCNIVTSFFAPFAEDEFRRVLDENGVFITAIPLENHLYELKRAIYDKPYKNKAESFDMEGWELLSADEISGAITLDNNKDICDLFMMTPYYYKTSEKDQKKLLTLDSLETQIHFAVLAYRKQITT